MKTEIKKKKKKKRTPKVKKELKNIASQECSIHRPAHYSLFTKLISFSDHQCQVTFKTIEYLDECNQ